MFSISPSLLVLCVPWASLVAAPELTMRNFTLPAFDASGHLIRRLSAETAVASATASRLGPGRVEFFAPTDSTAALAVLEFADARYVQATERIDGDGAFALTTKEGKIQGVGFECQLETGGIELKTAVTYDAETFHLTADRGRLRFDPKAPAKDQSIKEVILTGLVVVTRAATAKMPFDRAETALARYSAELQKVFLKKPVTAWRKGERWIPENGGNTEFLELDVSEKPAPAGTLP